MTRKLVYRPEAEQDIIAAAEWYEGRGSGLAAEFLRALDVAVASVQRSPLLHPQVQPRMHRALLRRFPYSLVYSVSDEEVVILACAHWRQNPRRWQRRQ